jgi:hypothetical protein
MRAVWHGLGEKSVNDACEKQTPQSKKAAAFDAP